MSSQVSEAAQQLVNSVERVAVVGAGEGRVPAEERHEERDAGRRAAVDRRVDAAEGDVREQEDDAEADEGLARHGVDVGVADHAGEGALHVRLVEGQKQWVEAILIFFFFRFLLFLFAFLLLVAGG